MATLSSIFSYTNQLDIEVLQPRLTVWATPSSLVTTKGISFDFFFSCYLDISVRRLTSIHLINKHLGVQYCASTVGFPIRKSPD